MSNRPRTASRSGWFGHLTVTSRAAGLSPFGRSRKSASAWRGAPLGLCPTGGGAAERTSRNERDVLDEILRTVKETGG